MTGTTLVLRGATVVDTRDGTPTAHQDVRIEGGTITAVGPTRPDEPAEPGVTVVDATGRYVVPGYVDMHAHPLGRPGAPDGALALMLANGITGFRQMSGSARLLADRRAGRLRLPEDSPALVAMPGSLLTPANAGTAKAAVRTVREQHADGADFIKVALVSPAVFFAAQAEATRLGIPVVGHLPTGIDVRAASRGGMRSIEHLGPGVGVLAACADHEAAIHDELARRRPLVALPFRVPFADRIVGSLLRRLVLNPAAAATPADVAVLREADDTFNEAKARELAAVLRADGTWQCPTLIRVRTQQFADAPEYAGDPNVRFLDPGAVADWRAATARFGKQPPGARVTFRNDYARRLRLVRIFDEEGVPMVAGTDACGAAWVVPGFSLHQEFAELAAAGLSPARILRMATLDAAEFLGTTATAGTVAPGKRADLVLLDADPTGDVRNLRAISGVVRDGRLSDAARLAAITEAVAAARSVS